MKSSSAKNYFPLPNQIFSLGLDAGEIAVLTYLMYCEDRSTFQCHPSYTTTPQVRSIYESLHKDLLYTDEQQNFDEALNAFEEINEILESIDE